MSDFTHSITARVVLDDGSVLVFDYSAQIVPVYYYAQGQVLNPISTVSASDVGQWDILALKSIGSYGRASIENNNSGAFMVFGLLQNMFVMHTNQMSVGDNSLTAPSDLVNFVDFNSPGNPDYSKWSFVAMNTTAS